MVCAGLTEHRTGAAWNGSRIHEGMDRGAAGSENLPADLQGWYSGRKERLRSNPQTMDRDSNRSCRITRHKRRRNTHSANHPHSPRLVGSAPQAPRDLAHCANPGEQQPETQKQKRDAPALSAGVPSPVLAPGAALGSRLRVALSSGQVIDHFINAPLTEPLPVRAAPATARRHIPISCCTIRTGTWPAFGLKMDVFWAGSTAPRALYAILGGRFFVSHPLLKEEPVQRELHGIRE